MILNAGTLDGEKTFPPPTFLQVRILKELRENFS